MISSLDSKGESYSNSPTKEQKKKKYEFLMRDEMKERVSPIRFSRREEIIDLVDSEEDNIMHSETTQGFNNKKDKDDQIHINKSNQLNRGEEMQYIQQYDVFVPKAMSSKTSVHSNTIEQEKMQLEKEYSFGISPKKPKSSTNSINEEIQGEDDLIPLSEIENLNPSKEEINSRNIKPEKLSSRMAGNIEEDIRPEMDAISAEKSIGHKNLETYTIIKSQVVDSNSDHLEHLPLNLVRIECSLGESFLEIFVSPRCFHSINMKEEHTLKKAFLAKFNIPRIDEIRNVKGNEYANLISNLQSHKNTYSVIGSEESRFVGHQEHVKSNPGNEIIFRAIPSKHMSSNQIITIKREEESMPYYRKQVYRKLRTVLEPIDDSRRLVGRRIALGLEARVNLTYHYTGELYLLLIKKIINKLKV